MVYSGEKGEVYDLPGSVAAFRTGRRIIRARGEDCIPMPHGSYLFSLPERLPVAWDRETEGPETVGDIRGTTGLCAASAFLPSAYLRTFLPAFTMKQEAPVLPLWAYCGVAYQSGGFVVPAVRIDDDPRSDPSIHENDVQLAAAIRRIRKRYPENRLVRQLSMCSTDYRCLCARNFFLSRFEAPVPTSPACNSRCGGCLSLQERESGFMESQPRLDFSPSPGEISEVILHHFGNVNGAVASFGQGCEGEPLLRGDDLVAAIDMVRSRTDRGTININTNGSRPDVVRKMIDAGLDSVRVSLNSPTEEYYNRYHRPVNYTFGDILKTIETALDGGIFVSLNLFFLPGFTDMETEVGELRRFLRRFPVNMIQTRNLNIDPDYYLDMIGFRESDPVGVPALLDLLRGEFPSMRLGYYNPSLRD